MSDNIKILVCAHKECELPKDDIYLPIQVGKAISDIDLGIQGDDTGDNISEKNQSFCELTALYWAWKNIKNYYPDLEYIGLCHYRRYLALDKWKTGRNGICLKNIPDMKDYKHTLNLYFKKYQMILAHRVSYPYNLKIDYSVHHYSDDYRTLKQIVHDLYPEYDDYFLFIFEHNNKLSHYNIFISPYSVFTEYCEWLFKILFEAERRINISNYRTSQKRIFGYLAERLLNVYVYHKKIKVLYKPIYWINDNKNRYYVDFLRSVKYDFLFFLQKVGQTK
jgi:hypothetical protein